MSDSSPHDQRDRIGASLDLSLEPVMDGDVLVRNGWCLGPLDEQLVPLWLREQRKVREPLPGILDNGLQQVSEVVRHAFNRRRREQVRAVLESDAEPVSLASGHHRQVEECSVFVRARSIPR